MTPQQIAERLKDALEGEKYKGSLSRFKAKSIENADRNYPVANLADYCDDMGVRIVMTDLATEDRFFPRDATEIHHTLKLLMDRYKVRKSDVANRYGLHYTPLRTSSKSNGAVSSLSIKVLLTVCDMIHCDISFERVHDCDNEPPT